MLHFTSMSLLGAPAADPCMTQIPEPPPLYVDVYPMFTIPVKAWTKEKGWSQTINYDFKQLFPKLAVCELNLLAVLTTQVHDHRTPTTPSGNCPAGHTERAGYCTDPATGKTTRITGTTAPPAPRAPSAGGPKTGSTITVIKGLGADHREGVCTIDRNSPWLGGGRLPEDVGEWARAAMAHPERLEPYLVKYGYNASAAPVLARWLVAKEALLRAMFKISAISYGSFKLAERKPPAPVMAARMRAALTRANYVRSYKGLTNPYVAGDSWAMFKPAFDGGQWLWSNIKPPFPEDEDYVWALYAEYKGGSSFRLTLKRIKRDKGALESLYDLTVGNLITLASMACKLITSEKLQGIRNAAGVVPEPHTQAVVQGWTAAAAVCGMAMPAQATVTCAPADPPPPPPPPPEASFWDKHQTFIVAGAVGVAALVAIKTLRRGKVAP